MAEQFTNQQKWDIVTYNAGSSDLNEISGNCIFYSSNAQNAPNGKSAGCVIQYVYGVFYKIQFYISTTGVLVRSYNNPNWVEWVEIG